MIQVTVSRLVDVLKGFIGIRIEILQLTWQQLFLEG